MLRIAVTGPESSGKTTLCKALSEYFKVAFVPEYARAYLKKTKGVYKQPDLDCMAKGQLESIENVKNQLLICDTDFSVFEVWSQFKYANVSAYILETVRKDLFDLHILCSPDIPWEEDELRETPNSRAQLFELYKESLHQHNKNYIVVSGSPQNRIEKSLQALAII